MPYIYDGNQIIYDMSYICSGNQIIYEIGHFLPENISIYNDIFSDEFCPFFNIV